MVEFSGWEMPVQYSGILQEHHAVRNVAGLFDIDHMGQFRVEGPQSLPYLQHLLSSDLSTLQENEAKYALLCYADGGTVDDAFVYRFSDHWMVVVNAGNRVKDLAWMEAHRRGWDTRLADVSGQFYMLAFQGPKAEEILQRLEGLDLRDLKYHTARWFQIQGQAGIVARTGYTGEDGFELFVPQEFGKQMWDAILAAGRADGVLPIGLGARDSLRFEAKMALYGHELDPQTTPIQAGLGWACDLDKHFIGRDALLKQKLEGAGKRLVGLEMTERGIARQGYPVLKEGQPVGVITSGMYSPTLDKNIALAYVRPDLGKMGTELEVQVRGKPVKARVCKTPFYPNRARGR